MLTNKKRLLGAGLLAGTLILAGGFNHPVYANTGIVSAAETCKAFTVVVTLNNNVTSDKFVQVTTTIPGTQGIPAPGKHYDTSYGQILKLTGAAPATGTVTLNVYNNNNGKPGSLEFGGTKANGGSASIMPPSNCPTPTTTPTATPTPTPTPTGPPLPKTTPTPMPSTTPPVPDTGTDGSMVIWVVAIALLLIGGVFYFTSRRKNNVI